MGDEAGGGPLFASLGDAYVAEGRASHGTMMGFPCLRRDGAFFASLDPATKALIVKLPAGRVTALVRDRLAESFAPNGRSFREWAAIPQTAADTWPELLAEAWSFANTHDPPAKVVRID